MVAQCGGPGVDCCNAHDSDIGGCHISWRIVGAVIISDELAACIVDAVTLCIYEQVVSTPFQRSLPRRDCGSSGDIYAV